MSFSVEDIETERLVLTPITDEALDREEAGGAPGLAGVEVAGWPPEHWEPHVFPFLRAQMAERPETRGWHRYIVLRAAGDAPMRLIGTVNAHAVATDEAEIGYSVLPAFQREGYGTEAARAFVAWLGTQPGVARISGQTYPELRGSVRVMEACGMVFVGAGDEVGTVRYRVVTGTSGSI